jgi:NAD(P)-dependent dehydrogenase (short-subunit alcohol dehydrogenase family)
VAAEVGDLVGTLDGRSVVVTGAGRGLGRAYAIAAADEGAAVVVNDVDAAEAAEVAGEIADRGGTAVPSNHDVTDPAAAEQIVATALDRFGRLDGLVNNAGVIETGPPWDVTPAQIDKLVDVNVRGVLLVATAAIRTMRGSGGVIVNVSSGAALGMPNLALYGATKGAVASATYGWSIDLAAEGIRVIGFSPLGRTRMGGHASSLPDPTAVAPAVAFLLGDGSRGLSGQIVRFDGRKLSLLRPPRFVEPSVERDAWTPADMSAAIADVLGPTAAPVGMAEHHISV